MPDRTARPDAPHILFVASAAEDYGSDRMLLQSVRALVADHRVTVVVPTDGPLRPRLAALGTTVVVHRDYAVRRRYLVPHRLPGLLTRNLATLLRLRRLHQRTPIDLVVTNTEAVVVGGVLAWLIARPHLWHVHEILCRPPALAKAMTAVVHRTSDRVLACSTAVRDHLVGIEPALAPRVTVLTNAVPLPDDRHLDERRALHRHAGVVRIGCIGRIHPWKGQRELVEAWIVAASRRPPDATALELHFFGDTIAGQDHLVVDLERRLTEAGLADTTTFHGFVADPDEVYPTLDVVVVPSTDPEPFSLVCAEAQGYGLPVIGPDRAGPAEIVIDGATGLLVDPTDPEALAAAISALADDPIRRTAFGTGGRERARRCFSLGRYHAGIRRVVAATLLGTTPIEPPAEAPAEAPGPEPALPRTTGAPAVSVVGS